MSPTINEVVIGVFLRDNVIACLGNERLPVANFLLPSPGYGRRLIAIRALTAEMFSGPCFQVRP